MGPRLELKHGLVPEADRLSESADTTLVTEPATGSKVRSKGNLYLVVSSSRIGGRAREATQLVAETIRREYYYDESAGVPICLEKAVRSANRKLRGSREGSGLPPGGMGIAMAVIRTNELYVATIGSAEAYLVRAARLLVPDHTQQPGLPADDTLRVEVWRGEIAVGDSLLLVSRNLTEVVGTEELKNAVVTLHPQSAVEHLHHLFVAAGGEGPDAVLAVEATELALARADRRLAPVSGGTDAFADMPGGPIPGGDQVVGAATAVSGAFGGAATAVSGAFGGAMDRLIDLMPRRDRTARSIPSRVSRRESQRRGAFALLGLLGVVLVLGLGVWLLPRGKEPSINTMSAGEQAFTSAQETAAEGSRLLSGDPVQATVLLQRAWHDLEQAVAAGIPTDRTEPLEGQIRTNLDQLYKVGVPKTSALYEFDEPTDIKALTLGPDGGIYYIAPARGGRGDSVWRLNKKHTRAYEIVKTGDAASKREVGRPRLLAMTALNTPTLLIVDDNGALWRWNQYGDKASGTLSYRRVGGSDVVWGDDVRDINTLTQFQSGTYFLYVLDPDTDQIHKYAPTLDGSRFDAPTNYLITKDESVADYLKLYIGDGNVYTLAPGEVVKHHAGRKVDWSLDDPPDANDLRPEHRYRLIDGTSPGRLFVYDEQWGRILVFLKSDGTYLEQWATQGALPSMEDMRGMYVTQRGTAQAPRTPAVVWATPRGIFRSTLTPATADVLATDAPDVSPGADE
jgi:serine/threonine protein phosphatase PrpC